MKDKYKREVDRIRKSIGGSGRKDVNPVFIILDDKDKTISDWKMKLVRWAYIFRRSIICEEYYPKLYIEPEDQSTAPVKIIVGDLNGGLDGLSFYKIRKLIKEMEKEK